MAMLATSVSGAALAQRCPGRCLGSRRGVSSACTSSTTNLPRLARLRRGGGCVLGLAPRGLRGSAVSAVRAVVTRASAPVPEGDATVASAELASASSSLSERSSHRSLGLAMAMVASAVLLHADPSLAADAAASGAGGGFPPLTWLTSGWNGVTSALSTPGAQELWLYTLKTVISWGVPAVTVAVAAFFVLGSNRRNRNAEGPKPGGGGPFAFLNGGKMSGANTPSPFVIKRLNDKLDSYAYAFQAATVSAESVENAQSRKAFADKYATVLGRLTSTERQAVTKAADRWAREEAMLRSRMATLARSMRAEAVAAASKNGGNKDQSASPADSFDVSSDEDSFPLLDEVEDEEERLAAAGPAATGDNISDDGNFEGFTLLSANATKNKLGKVAARRAEAEATYVRAVAAALPVHKRARLSKLLSDPRMSPGWEGGRDPLRVPEERMARRDKPHVYVLQFFGDVRASQAAALREEVTAVLRSAKPGRGDEVVLVLNTGGGTVTGYGLAAAQLTRLKAAGIRLTICVEQVAASGGYMMACTADRLVASPFAVLGSIGVISEVPNVYERLKKEGIEFQTVTAGKFKRTLTPTKRIEPKDLEKSQADIESILTLFKSFVGQQRPQLDIDNVATGETWFGEDALKQKLCDELKTTDDVLLELLKAGSEIFSVKFRPPQSGPSALLSLGGGDANYGGSAGSGAGGWGALRAMALGVAGFASAAGGIGGGVGLGGVGGGVRGALAMDASNVADKVMARDGQYYSGAAGDMSGTDAFVGSPLLGGAFDLGEEDQDNIDYFY